MATGNIFFRVPVIARGAVMRRKGRNRQLYAFIFVFCEYTPKFHRLAFFLVLFHLCAVFLVVALVAVAIALTV